MKKIIPREGLLKQFKVLVCGLFILVASCKKGDDNHTSVQKKVEPVLKDNQLFSIKEDGNRTLDIKGKGAGVVIYNSTPGNAIGNEGNQYKVVDEYGKEYTFNSATPFGSYSTTPLHGAIKIFKNNTLVFEEKHDFSKFHLCLANNHRNEDSQTGGFRTSGVGVKGTYWDNGQRIRVKFRDDVDSLYIKGKIKHYAKLWEPHANIYFDFVKSTDDADILISLQTGIGSWSYLGKQSRSFAEKGKASMNYGWFDNATDEGEFARVVIHEFGHALGLHHEQHQRDVLSTINDRALVLYYMNILKDNLMRKEKITESQITDEQQQKIASSAEKEMEDFLRITKSYDHSGRHDRLSIMHYPVPAEATHDGVGIGYNRQLSAGDIEFIKTIYPSTAAATELYDIKDDKGERCVTIIRDTRNGDIYAYKHRVSSFLNSYIIRPSTGNKSVEHPFTIDGLSDGYNLIGNYLPINKGGQGVELIEKSGSGGLTTLFSEASGTPNPSNNSNNSSADPFLDISNDKGEVAIRVIGDLRDGRIWVFKNQGVSTLSMATKRYSILVGLGLGSAMKSYQIDPNTLLDGYTDTGIKARGGVNPILIEMQEPGKSNTILFRGVR